jgi:hypothetical protein
MIGLAFTGGKLWFSSVKLEEGIIAFPIFILILAIESLIMLSVIINKLDLQDPFLLGMLLFFFLPPATPWLQKD